MKKEKFNELFESLNELTEDQKEKMFVELFKSIEDKDISLFRLFLNSTDIVLNFCNENCDLSGISSKKIMMDALGFAYYKQKNEFLEYMSEKYDYLQ